MRWYSRPFSETYTSAVTLRSATPNVFWALRSRKRANWTIMSGRAAISSYCQSVRWRNGSSSAVEPAGSNPKKRASACLSRSFMCQAKRWPSSVQLTLPG
jgi:hypothetical protein